MDLFRWGYLCISASSVLVTALYPFGQVCPKNWPQQCSIIISINNRNFAAKILQRIKILIHIYICVRAYRRHSFWPVIELQKIKCGGPLYPSFPQQHGPYGIVKISEGAGILWLPCNSNTVFDRTLSVLWSKPTMAVFLLVICGCVSEYCWRFTFTACSWTLSIQHGDDMSREFIMIMMTTTIIIIIITTVIVIDTFTGKDPKGLFPLRLRCASLRCDSER